jgi:hypothetical protein
MATVLAAATMRCRSPTEVTRVLSEASSTAKGDRSRPTARRPMAMASMSTVPEPQKGSSSVAPAGSERLWSSERATAGCSRAG